MNNQVKVNQVESYKDSQVNTIVCKGKLVSIECSKDDALLARFKKDSYFGGLGNVDDTQIANYKGDIILYDKQHNYPSSIFEFIKPIIISETKSIEVGDNIIVNETHNNNIIIYGSEIKKAKSRYAASIYVQKVLALPEQLSPKHLSAIVDGKLKDGDVCFIECEIDYMYAPKVTNNIIKLNKSNHIKLFPVKQEESWDEVIEYVNSILPNEKITLNQLSILYHRYNPPTKKN